MTMTTMKRRGDGDDLLTLLKVDVDFGEYEVWMDVTAVMEEAMKDDARRGYEGSGPATGIEWARALEYADHVAGKATFETLAEFNTKDYSLSVELKQNSSSKPPRPRGKGWTKRNLREEAENAGSDVSA